MSLKYRVTVDGTAYVVEVEELGAGAPVTSAPAAAVSAAPAPAAADAPAPEAGAAAGGVVIEAPMPGKILDVKVSAGAAVKSGDLIVILEAMKMENEIFATASGTVKEVRVKRGNSVSTGDALVVIG
ncbi:MAG: biotin/lipoyl-binding protein [Synergistaceae bacterium]|nr:biotin/lipoyl-binding protein [Synergistaceae bacterium]